jgi:hypothetical protein
VPNKLGLGRHPCRTPHRSYVIISSPRVLPAHSWDFDTSRVFPLTPSCPTFPYASADESLVGGERDPYLLSLTPPPLVRAFRPRFCTVRGQRRRHQSDSAIFYEASVLNRDRAGRAVQSLMIPALFKGTVCINKATDLFVCDGGADTSTTIKSKALKKSSFRGALQRRAANWTGFDSFSYELFKIWSWTGLGRKRHFPTRSACDSVFMKFNEKVFKDLIRRPNGRTVLMWR